MKEIKNNKKGSTLVEVVVAFVIILFCIGIIQRATVVSFNLLERARENNLINQAKNDMIFMLKPVLISGSVTSETDTNEKKGITERQYNNLYKAYYGEDAPILASGETRTDEVRLFFRDASHSVNITNAKKLKYTITVGSNQSVVYIFDCDNLLMPINTNPFDPNAGGGSGSGGSGEGGSGGDDNLDVPGIEGVAVDKNNIINTSDGRYDYSNTEDGGIFYTHLSTRFFDIRRAITADWEKQNPPERLNGVTELRVREDGNYTNLSATPLTLTTKGEIYYYPNDDGYKGYYYYNGNWTDLNNNNDVINNINNGNLVKIEGISGTNGVLVTGTDVYTSSDRGLKATTVNNVTTYNYPTDSSQFGIYYVMSGYYFYAIPEGTDLSGRTEDPDTLSGWDWITRLNFREDGLYPDSEYFMDPSYNYSGTLNYKGTDIKILQKRQNLAENDILFRPIYNKFYRVTNQAAGKFFDDMRTIINEINNTSLYELLPDNYVINNLDKTYIIPELCVLPRKGDILFHEGKYYYLQFGGPSHEFESKEDVVTKGLNPYGDVQKPILLEVEGLIPKSGGSGGSGGGGSSSGSTNAPVVIPDD